MKIKTIIWSDPKVGDKIEVEGSNFREGVQLFICYIGDELIYYSYDPKAPKSECETAFSEDVLILR